MKPMPNFPSPVFPETPTFMYQCRETVSVVEGGGLMAYESPAVQYEGAFNDVLRRLFPYPRKERLSVDRRIMKLLHFIDSHEGSIGWDLDHACRELRLDISGANAARLFNRCTGLGGREDSKKRRGFFSVGPVWNTPC